MGSAQGDDDNRQRFTLARTRFVSANAGTRISTPRLQPGNVSRFDVFAGVFAIDPSLALSREDACTLAAQTLALESGAGSSTTLFLLFALVPA